VKEIKMSTMQEEMDEFKASVDKLGIAMKKLGEDFRKEVDETMIKIHIK
jgi:cytochrome c556